MVTLAGNPQVPEGAGTSADAASSAPCSAGLSTAVYNAASTCCERTSTEMSGL